MWWHSIKLYSFQSIIETIIRFQMQHKKYTQALTTYIGKMPGWRSNQQHVQLVQLHPCIAWNEPY